VNHKHCGDEGCMGPWCWARLRERTFTRAEVEALLVDAVTRQRWACVRHIKRNGFGGMASELCHETPLVGVKP